MLIYWHHCYLCSSSCATDSLIWLVPYKPCCVLLTGDHASNITTGKYHKFMFPNTHVHVKALCCSGQPTYQQTNLNENREKNIHIYYFCPQIK